MINRYAILALLFIENVIGLNLLANLPFSLIVEKTNGNGYIIESEYLPIADPYIILYKDKYYAYGTGGTTEGKGFACFSSNDLKNWKREGQALSEKDSYGTWGFWAPEVYYIESKRKFYMYYSADEHICVAVADFPTGPFTQVKKEPMIADEKCIDNSLFIDDNGIPYLFFVRFNDGNNIWVAELESDLMTIKRETMHHCIHLSQSWEEVWPRVNEGPYVIKHNGMYYMTYSANSYESPFYGIGCATTNNIMGEWIKYTDNPLLQSPGNLRGIGHNAIFTDKEGKLRIVYHAHKNKNTIHPRVMHIGTISFKNVDGVDKLQISKEYTTPELIQ